MPILRDGIRQIDALGIVSCPSPSDGSILSYKTNIWRDSIRAWNIGAGNADGAGLVNTTSAASGAQQHSPRLRLGGQGWKTDATAASQAVEFFLKNVPIQGTSAPTGKLYFSSSINGAAATDHLYMDSSGNIKWESDLGGNIGASGANRPGFIYSAWSNATSGFICNSTELRQANFSTGLGSTGSLIMTANYPLIMLNQGRTDGAGNIVNASVYDVNAAAIDEDTILHSVGWTNNVNAYQEQIAIKDNGVVRFVNSWAVIDAPTGQDGDLAFVTNGDTGSACLALSVSGTWYRIALGAAISAT